MAHKRKRNAHTCKIIRFPTILFTLEMVRVIQEALEGFATLFAISPRTYPNFEFGLQTITRLQDRFHEMIEKERFCQPLPLDYNEIILLHTALLLLAHRLQGSALIDGRKAFQMCEEIRSMLPPLPFELSEQYQGT
jgi:hypothetical protein